MDFQFQLALKFKWCSRNPVWLVLSFCLSRSVTLPPSPFSLFLHPMDLLSFVSLISNQTLLWILADEMPRMKSSQWNKPSRRKAFPQNFRKCTGVEFSELIWVTRSSLNWSLWPGKQKAQTSWASVQDHCWIMEDGLLHQNRVDWAGCAPKENQGDVARKRCHGYRAGNITIQPNKH